LFGEAEVVTQSIIIATPVLINQKRNDHHFSTNTDSKKTIFLDPSIIKEIDETEKRKVVVFWLRSG